jgi:hypothetical protein
MEGMEKSLDSRPEHTDKLDADTRKQLAAQADKYEAPQLAAKLRENDNMWDIQDAGLKELGRERYVEFLLEARNQTLAHLANSTFVFGGNEPEQTWYNKLSEIYKPESAE